jgi:predicted CoA-binding protein
VNPSANPSDEIVKALLEASKTIAVIGLSPIAARPSYGVTRYMISHGYEIFGVRPASPPEVLGRPMVEKIADLEHSIDIIDVFRNSDSIPALLNEVEIWMNKMPIPSRPKCLWLQEGVSHSAAEDHARSLGLIVVSNRCILKDHARLIG